MENNDDLLVNSQNFENLCKDIRNLFDLMRKYYLKLKPSKAQLFKDKIIFWDL